MVRVTTQAGAEYSVRETHAQLHEQTRMAACYRERDQKPHILNIELEFGVMLSISYIIAVYVYQHGTFQTAAFVPVQYQYQYNYQVLTQTKAESYRY